MWGLNYAMISRFSAKFLLLLIVLSGLSLVVSATDITGPMIITQPGLYNVVNDISCPSGTCIGIQSNNVVLDGGNHTLLGTYGSGVGISNNVDYLEIRNLTINGFNSGYSYGINAHGLNDYLNFHNLNISNNVYGLRIEGGNNRQIHDSTIIGNQYGIDLYGNMEVFNNNFISNTQSGLKQWQYSGSSIFNNHFIQNLDGITFWQSSSNQIYNNYFTNNTQKGISIAASNSNSNTIRNNTFQNNTVDGVYLSGNSGNIIRNNIFIENSNAGVFLDQENDENPVYNNDFISNAKGIQIISSTHSNITSNNITSSTDAGIYLTSSQNNNITKNFIFGNVKGVAILYANNNSLSNNYFNNVNNVDLQSSGSNNYWNQTNSTGPNIVGGPFIGGNYWANPSANGYSQTCNDSNGDGFCEAPYSINYENLDYLPLHTGQQVTHTISASAVNGTISPSGAVTVVHGASQSFNFTATPGYQIASVMVDGQATNATSPYTFSNVVTNHTIVATFSLVQPTVYTIMATAGLGGTIYPSGQVQVTAGSNQTFTVTPNTRFGIDSVSVDGTSQGAISTYTFPYVTANHTIAASFRGLTQTWYINATAATGASITPSGMVPVLNGQNLTFNITTLPCYNIINVVVNSVSLGPLPSYTFTNVTANQSIAVQCTQRVSPITATAGTGGTISPSGIVNVPCGSDQQFTMTPDANYELAAVLVDGQGIGTPRTYTFMNVQVSHQISATFTRSGGSFAINATSDPYTIVSPHGISTYKEGENKTYLTQAKPGSDLVQVVVDNFTSPPVGSWTFTNITKDHNLTTFGRYSPGQVQVLFAANQTWGPASMAVQYIDQSVGGPTSFYWQFGDGFTSTDQSPIHLYQTPGVYTVTLRATNSQSGGVGVWNNAITVTSGIVPKPTPTPIPGEIRTAFTATPLNGSAPVDIRFMDQSTGNPVSWTWDFGDGQLSILQNPSHRYTSAGLYSVTLLAQNTFYSGSLTKPGYVTVN